jgi:hypothetical protein
MSQASVLEQEMLELLNAERAKVGVNPLTFNDNLNSAAEDHSDWMLENNTFSHDGVSGTEPIDRVVDAGYELEGTYAVGENIGWQSIRGEPGLSDDVVQVHENLMNSPSHRAAILNPLFTEVGIGIEDGDFFADNRDWDSIMVTQNFGTTEAEDNTPEEPEQFVTPVDPVAPDDTPNEDETVLLADMAEEDDDGVEPASEATTEEQHQAITNDELNTEVTDASDTLIFTGFDGGSFDWRDGLNFDFLDDLVSGNGNNNGNGNTGGGINGQSNGFGNNGSGVNGTGNGNGNSDWWNDQPELAEFAIEPDTANDDLALEVMGSPDRLIFTSFDG